MKVLVLDDNQETTDMLAIYFETQGVDVITINDGRQGLELIRKEKFHLILLDLAMPNFSGIDIIDHLDKENVIGSKNIVIFTASSVKDELLEELKKSIKGILKKPIDFDELEALVTKFRET
ncbi:MAG TPA: response regulator [Nitrososphaeraceae archaeon]